MSQVRPLRSPILVGRDDLLALAERRLAEAAAGRPQTLMFSGEAGIGKTRMIESVMRKARAAGFRVARGDLGPHDRQVLLASVLDLARAVRRDPAFVTLGSDLLGLQGAQGADSLGARRLLVRGIADRILTAVDVPTALAFDDLQWADELSLEVIGELARLGRDRPLLLLAAYRVDELRADTAHREWRARLLNQRLAEEARLQPLRYEEIAVMATLILGSGLPAPREVVTALHARTDGIPLHVEELLGALDDRARTDGHAIREATVPDTIEDAVLARLGRLSDDARTVARAGAVMGRCFDPEVLAGIMDRPASDLDGPLEELVASSFLHPFAFVDRGYFDFRHQLLRDVLYGTVPATELRRLHARAGEFCMQLEGASTIHASVHFERAGLRAQAFRAALSGAEAASAVSSRREAFELYARAVGNVPGDLTPGELGELHEAYAEAAASVDRVPLANEMAAVARRHFLEAGRLVDAARMLVMHAAMARRDARPIAARDEYLAHAIAELDALPSGRERDSGLAQARLVRGILRLDGHRLEEAASDFREADRFAVALEDADLAHEVGYWRSTLDVLSGRVATGLETTLGIARRARDARFENCGVSAFRNAALLGVRVQEYRRAEEGMREGLRYADEVEQSYCRHAMASASAFVAWADGRWDDAVQIAEQELVESGSRRAGIGCRDVLGFVAFGRGAVERARTLLAESLAAGRESGEVALVLPALWGLAETSLLADAADDAIDLCEEALTLAVATGERALLVPFVVTGARAYLVRLRPDAAERWLETLGGMFADWASLAAPALRHAEGLVRTSIGSTVAARAALQSAVATWEERGRTWEALWARLDLGACLLRANREAEAVTVILEVTERAGVLESTPLRLRAEELLAVASGRGAESEPWRPLTAREFQVARLVADGMTNVEIGATLGMSPRTAGAHVEHILTKLAFTRRAEIGAWVGSMRTPEEAAASVRG